MAVTIEYKNGIFYIDNKRAFYPQDADHQSAPPIMGLDYDTGEFVPAKISSDGKLYVSGITVESVEVTLGSVKIRDTSTTVEVNVEADSGKNAIYVQSNSLANAAKQDTIVTGVNAINNTLLAQLDVTTGGLKVVQEETTAAINTQIDTKTSELGTKLDTIDTTVLAQIDTKTSVLNSNLLLIKNAVQAVDVSVNAQVDTKTSVLNTSINSVVSAITTQVDTKTSVLSTKLDTINTSINTQVDTKTSALNTSLGMLHTDLTTISGTLDSIETNTDHIIDGTQKTKILNVAGTVIDSTDVSGQPALNVYVKGGISLSVTLDHDTDSVSIWGTDGSVDKKLKTDEQGELQVDILSSVLPVGAATETKQDNFITEQQSTNGKLDTANITLNNIKTDTGNIDTKQTSIDTKLNGLIDGNQKSQVINGSGQTIGIGAHPVFVDDSPMGMQNMVADYTYYATGNGVGKVHTIKEYPTGATPGSPAKLSTYTYNTDHKVSQIKVEDSVSP